MFNPLTDKVVPPQPFTFIILRQIFAYKSEKTKMQAVASEKGCSNFIEVDTLPDKNKLDTIKKINNKLERSTKVGNGKLVG